MGDNKIRSNDDRFRQGDLEVVPNIHWMWRSRSLARAVRNRRHQRQARAD